MKETLQKTMKAAAIDGFGGTENIAVKDLPVPEIDADEILIRVESAGIGQWDPFEREGGFAEMSGKKPKFPYVMGTDGAGTVAAVGDRVTQFKEGDRVYGMSFASPKGGFYAQYAAVKAQNVAKIPQNLPTVQAGALAADGITALRGLDDILDLQKGEKLLILGASGGVGHLALQLAKIMGARVLAVASGSDGVALAKRLGADTVIDGHKDDIAAAARKFAPEGLDAALLTAGGEAAEAAIEAVRKNGRVAYPNGVEPEPQAPSGVNIRSYDGLPDQQILAKLNRLIEVGPFEVHLGGTFPLDMAAEAQCAVESHHVGKINLRLD